MDETQYFTDLERALSRERLAPYRPPGGGDLDLIANYLWNVALSEALYPILQSLEVTLRNATHNAATIRFGTDLWFDQPAVLRLESREREMVNRAKQNLLDHQLRTHGPRRVPAPLTSGQIVAELMFGFWTGIMNAPYEVRLWAPPPPTIGILDAVFLHAPRRWRSRKPLLARLNRIRLLRNRVSHYEHVRDWAQPGIADIRQQHSELLETINWIDPTVAMTVRLIDRFPMVYSQGRAFHRTMLDLMLNP